MADASPPGPLSACGEGETEVRFSSVELEGFVVRVLTAVGMPAA